MSFTALLIHTVTVSNPTTGIGVNAYGDANAGTPTTVQEQVRIEPVRRFDFFVEELRNRDTRVVKHRLFAPATTAITALSTITWGARTFNVVSRPAMVPDGTGNHHIEALLEEIEG
jgi:hypothetical protein